MNDRNCIGIGIVSLVLLLIGCNPAKNTAINRAYHSTTAHYNGYFNANILLDQALNSYRNNYKEDFYTRIPIERYPTENEAKDMYPAIDTAIAKCTKVIQEHSMPGSTTPSKKKEENNTFIDENWLTVGIASYLRLDYSAAMKNFMFIKKFYTNDPSNYIGELWMAKTNIALKKYTEAGFNLDVLDKALEEEAIRNSEKKSLKQIYKNLTASKRKKKKAKKEKSEIAEFPKKILFDFYQTKADLFLIRGDKEKAIENLILATKETRKKAKKARVYFVLGQLYQELGMRQEANESYTRVIKSQAPFEMEFSARMKRALMGSDEKLVKQLNKMLRDAKNAEFKDQIYHALAQIELEKGNEPGVYENLTNSAFYSTSNSRQKAMAYEQMGDMKFAKKDYVPAQKYYDSTAKVMPESYPNHATIINKATKLNDLVVAVETAYFEDSVQRIALLSESERSKFLDGVSAQLKKQEIERKKKEEEKLLSLQRSENQFNQSQGGNKWYFRNAKTRAAGYDEFRRLWGTRENEDNWRRSDKIVTVAFKEQDKGNTDSTALTGTDVVPKKADPFSTEVLLADIPLDDSSMLASNLRMVKALYDAGVIYKDQLDESKLAAQQFTTVVDTKPETRYKLMSAFQLYKLFEKTDLIEAEKHKNYIINYYPNSDYANYLRDPDYFIKKKDIDARSEKEYVEALNRYRSGLYYPALSRSESVILNEPENPLRAKYMLLKAMSQGKLNEDKTTLLPTLNQLVKEFPKTEEADRAQAMIDIINNGFSKNSPVDFSNKSIYTYEDRAKQFVMVFLDSTENSSLARSKVTDFNKEYFSRSKLKVSSKIFGADQSIILIDDFETDLEAKAYLRVFKSTRKHLFDLQKAKTIIITQENLKTLFLTQKLQEYDNFFDEYY